MKAGKSVGQADQNLMTMLMSRIDPRGADVHNAEKMLLFLDQHKEKQADFLKRILDAAFSLGKNLPAFEKRLGEVEKLAASLEHKS
jgi:hypothetical protein